MLPARRLHLVRTCANPGGAKPVLLLLHGFPEGWFSWRRQIEALRGEGWCVVAMDLRGYGGSDKPQVGGSQREW
jgi:pimeloyl-ACP methyl ester carboxylesterase